MAEEELYTPKTLIVEGFATFRLTQEGLVSDFDFVVVKKDANELHVGVDAIKTEMTVDGNLFLFNNMGGMFGSQGPGARTVNSFNVVNGNNNWIGGIKKVRAVPSGPTTQKVVADWSKLVKIVLSNRANIHINEKVPKIRSLTLSGGSHLQCTQKERKCENLVVTVITGSTVKIELDVKYVNLAIGGASKCKLGVVSECLLVEATGGSTVDVTANKECDENVASRGSSNVKVHRLP